MVCCRFPEPLIGNWKASFVIVGINPGPSSGDFKDSNQYIAYYSNPKKCGLKSQEGWQRGYLEAYRRLVNPELSNDEAIDHFNSHAAILNIIKCSTVDASKLRGQRYESAKTNCIGYLEKQLELISPKIILTHGKKPCIEILDMLKSKSKYVEVQSSTNINILAEKIKDSYSMDRILPTIKYITAKDREGREVLFLFNKHLSRWGPAQKSLKQDLEEKQRRVKVALH